MGDTFYRKHAGRNARNESYCIDWLRYASAKLCPWIQRPFDAIWKLQLDIIFSWNKSSHTGLLHLCDPNHLNSFYWTLENKTLRFRWANCTFLDSFHRAIYRFCIHFPSSWIQLLDLSILYQEFAIIFLIFGLSYFVCSNKIIKHHLIGNLLLAFLVVLPIISSSKVFCRAVKDSFFDSLPSQYEHQQKLGQSKFSESLKRIEHDSNSSFDVCLFLCSGDQGDNILRTPKRTLSLHFAKGNLTHLPSFHSSRPLNVYCLVDPLLANDSFFVQSVLDKFPTTARKTQLDSSTWKVAFGEPWLITMNNLLSPEKPDLSVVIPCLNEEDTLGTCLSKLETIAKDENFSMEVIVADNGSQDKSVEIAAKFNARVVRVSRKGYGAALMGGIEAKKSRLFASE